MAISTTRAKQIAKKKSPGKTKPTRIGLFPGEQIGPVMPSPPGEARRIAKEARKYLKMPKPARGKPQPGKTIPARGKPQPGKTIQRPTTPVGLFDRPDNTTRVPPSKLMRGGGSVQAKKMRGGGMAKMASKKKMMRGGMAKKKK